MVEQTETVRMMMWVVSVEPGQLCHTVMPTLEMLLEGLMMNSITTLSDAVFDALVGDPTTYDIKSHWYDFMFISLVVLKYIMLLQ